MNIAEQLRRDEGERACVYQDSLGFWTIGCGRLVDPRKPSAGLRSSEIDYLLKNDIEDRVLTLTRNLPWFAQLDEARQGVLINMAFQLGVNGALAFTTTLTHVRAGRWEDAAVAMLDSLWATQTPERAQRLAEQMRTGTWQ